MYLYIVVSANGLFKIGKTWEPKARIAQLKAASPVECETLALVEYDDTSVDLESEYHGKFADKRVRGEWFALSKGDLLSIIPQNKELVKLLEEMQSWGFFALGLSELLYPAARAALWRIQTMQTSKGD